MKSPSRILTVMGAWGAGLMLIVLAGCGGCETPGGDEHGRQESQVIQRGFPDTPRGDVEDSPRDVERRRRLVESWGGSIRDRKVRAAMGSVRRHAFVPPSLRSAAYDDEALPIGEGQTISQPWVVARMTELLGVSPGDRVLEVGTGSGYQAAVLARLGARVHTIEIIEALGRRARDVLGRLGYDTIRFRIGDGYAGWPEAAPFDAVIVTAAVDHVPQPLVDQLAGGGRLVLPLGTPGKVQTLTRITRTGDGLKRERFSAVRFVPMTGKAQRRD